MLVEARGCIFRDAVILGHPWEIGSCEYHDGLIERSAIAATRRGKRPPKQVNESRRTGPPKNDARRGRWLHFPDKGDTPGHGPKSRVHGRYTRSVRRGETGI
jgi:hypothetical protein